LAGEGDADQVAVTPCRGQRRLGATAGAVPHDQRADAFAAGAAGAPAAVEQRFPVIR
jgi:hypothetical protein